MKHTPGPWFATTRQGSWVVASAKDPNTEVCQMFHDGTDENELGEANSRLVAAAPDMLAVLQQIESEMRAGLGSSYGETREQVRRAIRRATQGRLNAKEKV